MLTFQSRFGRAKWLEPATDRTVKALAKSGVKNIAVLTPGFSADCLETLEEIAVENAHIFKRYGGREIRRDPVPERQRAGHAGDLADGAARAERLGLKPTALVVPPRRIQAACALQYPGRLTATCGARPPSPHFAGGTQRAFSMFFGFDVFAVVFVVLAVLVLFAGVKTVTQGYNWTVERFGKYTQHPAAGPRPSSSRSSTASAAR